MEKMSRKGKKKQRNLHLNRFSLYTYFNYCLIEARLYIKKQRNQCVHVLNVI